MLYNQYLNFILEGPHIINDINEKLCSKLHIITFLASQVNPMHKTNLQIVQALGK